MWKYDSTTYVASTLTFAPGYQININVIQFNFSKMFHLVICGISIKNGEKSEKSILFILNKIIAIRLVLKI